MAAIQEKRQFPAQGLSRESGEGGQKMPDDQVRQLRELQETNKKLSDTIASQETKNGELVAKNQKLKAISRGFKHSVASQCKFCHAFHPAGIFLEHV